MDAQLQRFGGFQPVLKRAAGHLTMAGRALQNARHPIIRFSAVLTDR
jgi:hypothetical protein